MCYACKRPNCRQVSKKIFFFWIVEVLETRNPQIRASEKPLGNAVTIINLLISSLCYMYLFFVTLLIYRIGTGKGCRRN